MGKFRKENTSSRLRTADTRQKSRISTQTTHFQPTRTPSHTLPEQFQRINTINLKLITMNYKNILTTTATAFAVLSMTPTKMSAAEPSLSEVLKKVKELETENLNLKKGLEALRKETNKLTADAMKRSKDGYHGGTSSGAEDEYKKRMKDISLDTPMPTEPAFMALGVTGSLAPELTTPRKFASGLVNGVDKSGNLKQGIAVSTNLGLAWDYLMDNTNPLQPYKGRLAENSTMDYLTRLLYRSNFSLATSKGTSDADKSVRLALGLSTSFYLHYDPYAIWHDPANNPERARALEELGLERNATDEQIVERMNKVRFLESGISFGAAPTWLSPEGKLQSLDSDGYTLFLTSTWVSQFWTKLKWVEDNNTSSTEKDGNKSKLKLADIQPLDPDQSILGLTLHARFRGSESWNAKVKDKKGKEITLLGEQDVLSVAGRLTYGSANFNVAVEGGYLHIMDGPRGYENAWQVGGAINTRIAENVYFVVSTGQTYGADEEYFAMGSIRFGTSDDKEMRRK